MHETTAHTGIVGTVVQSAGDRWRCTRRGYGTAAKRVRWPVAKRTRANVRTSRRAGAAAPNVRRAERCGRAERDGRHRPGSDRATRTLCSDAAGQTALLPAACVCTDRALN